MAKRVRAMGCGPGCGCEETLRQTSAGTITSDGSENNPATQLTVVQPPVSQSAVNTVAPNTSPAPVFMPVSVLSAANAIDATGGSGSLDDPTSGAAEEGSSQDINVDPSAVIPNVLMQAGLSPGSQTVSNVVRGSSASAVQSFMSSGALDSPVFLLAALGILAFWPGGEK